MSSEGTRKRERFRRLSRLFDELSPHDPSTWDDLLAQRHGHDAPLAAEVRALLALDRSGAPEEHLGALVADARRAWMRESVSGFRFDP